MTHPHQEAAPESDSLVLTSISRNRRKEVKWETGNRQGTNPGSLADQMHWVMELVHIK
jgi:hypothetical protein